MKKEIFNNYATAIAQQFHLQLDDVFTKSRNLSEWHISKDL